MSGRRGLSIVELLIPVAIGSALVFFMTQMLSSVSKKQDRGAVRGEALNAVMNLGNHLLSVGRSAMTCRIPSSESLECDFLPAGTTNLKTLRFKRETVTSPKGRAIRVVEVTEGTVLRQSYPSKNLDADVIEFTVCDGIRMAANNCDIEPTKVSSEWGSIWMNKNVYIRFRVRIALPGELTTGRNLSYQSAFFVRNAMPVDGLLFVSGRDK